MYILFSLLPSLHCCALILSNIHDILRAKYSIIKQRHHTFCSHQYEGQRMDFDFFCIPLIFGCSSRVTPDGVQTPRICPNCHNLSVSSGKKRTWLELCCVPVIPLSSSHVWMCPICNWTAKTNDFQPQMPGAGPPGGYYPAPGHYPPPSQYPAPVYMPYGTGHAGPPHH